MQLINAITFLAASVAAAPAFDTFGIRYTDHQCKTLHSQPNRDFPRNVCIDLYTVNSVKLLYASSVCEIYKERDCKGKSSSWVWSDGADNGTCLNTADKEWQGGRSFRCYIGKN